MYYRRKLILALLEISGRPLSSTDLQKYLFLLANRQKKAAYEFVPYRYGCYSFQLDQDLRTMKKIQLLNSSVVGKKETWQKQTGENYLPQLKPEDRLAMQGVHNRFKQFTTRQLVHHTYVHYPYYAIKSRIAARLLAAEDWSRVQAEVPRPQESVLFTIGYEGISLEHYLNRLIKQGVQLLCDVRRNSFSMKYGFSKRQLQHACESVGVQYWHVPALGIVSDKRKSLHSLADYENLFDEYEQTTLTKETEALQQVADVFENYQRVALTCFEREVCMCHRGRVAKHLVARPGWKIPLIHL